MISAVFRKKIMAKHLAELSNRLSISSLNNERLFDQHNFKSGSISWTWGKNENKIGFSIAKDNQGTPAEKIHLGLFYTITRNDIEKSDMNYKIEIAKTPCYYGGVRYWFSCPICSQRVGVLYLVDKWFTCRHCGEIVYSSQRQSEKYKGFVSIPDIERAEAKVKRYYYKGKPTRKYRKVLKLNDQFEYGLVKAYARINKGFGR